MLTCRELVALITDYLEGKLSLGQRLGFHLHLGFCGNCRRYLRQMEWTVTALGELPKEDTLPPALRDELLARFQGWKKD